MIDRSFKFDKTGAYCFDCNSSNVRTDNYFYRFIVILLLKIAYPICLFFYKTKRFSTRHTHQRTIASAEYSLNFSTRMLVSLLTQSKYFFKIMKMTSIYSNSDLINITTTPNAFARKPSCKRASSETHD